MIEKERERETQRDRYIEREIKRERHCVCVSTTKNEGVKRKRAKHRVKTVFDSFPTSIKRSKCIQQLLIKHESWEIFPFNSYFLVNIRPH